MPSKYRVARLANSIVIASVVLATSQTPAAIVEPSDLLPENGDYYSYQGSLTPPPCIEGGRWFVMIDSLTLSTEQVVAYIDRFGTVARPVQPTSGRNIELKVD